MARKSDAPSRGEISEKTDKSRDDMREKEEELDVTATDVETVRHTLDSLDFGGTAEGGNEVEASIEKADDATVEVFDEQDQALEGIQDENEEHQGELQERSDTSESDLGKLSDASAQLETDAALNEFVGAKDAAMQDIEFLGDQVEQARDAREESERVQREQQARVRSGGGK